METKFNIPVELKDKDFCDGCPALNVSTIYGYDCDYFEFGGWGKEDLMQEKGCEPNIIRPDVCKERLNND